MRIWKRGRVWWCWYYNAQGERVRESTQQTDRKAAENWQRERERTALDPGHRAAHEATVTNALELLLADRLARTKATPPRGSLETVQFYREKGAHVARVFGAQFRLVTLCAGDADRYIATRRTEGAHEATICKELVTLRAGLKLAKRAGLWRGDVEAVLPVGFAPAYEPRERWLTPTEAHGLVNELGDDRGARVAFMLATGAEWSATERALRADLPEHPTRVLLRGTKRKTRHREVPVVAEWQRTYLKHARDHGRGTGELLFAPWPSVARDLRAAMARLGCKLVGCDGRQAKNKRAACTDPAHAKGAPAPCTPNDLRRTFAHWMRGAGVPLELLAPLMGHATTLMVQVVYGRLDPAELRTRLEQAIGCDTVVTTPALPVAFVASLAETPAASTAGIPGESGGPCRGRTDDQRIKRPGVLLRKPKRSRIVTAGSAGTVTQMGQRAAGRGKRGGR